MLLPKRVKYRRVHRGRLTGKAMRGNIPKLIFFLFIDITLFPFIFSTFCLCAAVLYYLLF